jgi:hypothetical protein
MGKIIPFKDTLTTLDVRDWSRGLATYFPSIKIDSGQFSVLYNMLMEPDKSIRVRSGYDPMDGDISLDLDFSGFSGETAVSFFKTSDIDSTTTNDDEYRFLTMQRATDVQVNCWGYDTGGLTAGTSAWSQGSFTMDTDLVPEFFTYTVNDTKDVFCCNGANTPKRIKMSGTAATAVDLGLGTPTGVTAAITQMDSIAFGQLAGTASQTEYYKYSYFYADGTKYGESNMSAGLSVTVSGEKAGKITLTVNSWTNYPEISHVNFYRSANSKGLFRFVDSVQNPNTGTALAFHDRTPTEYEGELAPLDTTYVPKFKYPIVGPSGRIWGVDGEHPYKIVFSRKGQPDVFDALAYTYLPSNCTGLAEFNNSMYAFTEDACYQLLNSDPNKHSFQKITDVGCIEHRTIRDVENGLIWFNGSNVYWANFNFRSIEEGDFPIPIGDPIKDKFIDISRINLKKTRSAYVNNRYYISFCSPFESVNVRTLCYDVVLGTPLVRSGKYGGWSELDIHFQDAMAYRDRLLTLDDPKKYIYEHGNLEGVDYTNYANYDTKTNGVDIPFEMASGHMLLGADKDEKHIKAISLVADASDIDVNVNVDMNDGEFDRNKVITLSTGTLSRYTNPMIYNNTRTPYYLDGDETIVGWQNHSGATATAVLYTTGPHGFATAASQLTVTPTGGSLQTMLGSTAVTFTSIANTATLGRNLPISCYYPMDDYSGTNIADGASGNNPLLLGGDGTWVDAESHGRGISFTALGNISEADVTVAEQQVGTSDATLGFWIKPTDNTAPQAVVSNYYPLRTAGYKVETTSTGMIEFTQGDGTNSTACTSTTALTLNTWNFVAVVRDATNSKVHIYQNGQWANKDLTGSNADLDSLSSTFRVGSYTDATKFSITEVFLCNTLPMNKVELDYLYNEGYGRPLDLDGSDYVNVGYSDGTLRVLTFNHTIDTNEQAYDTSTGTVELQQPGGVWSSALTESVSNRVKLSNRLKGLIVKLSLSSSAGKRTRFQMVKLFYRIFPKSM